MWALAESSVAIFLISARQRDSKDGLSTFLVYVFVGREVLDTPISKFKIDCGMFVKKQRAATERIAELMAAEDITPWELRDKTLDYDDIISREPSRPIHGYV